MFKTKTHGVSKNMKSNLLRIGWHIFSIAPPTLRQIARNLHLQLKSHRR